MTTYGSTDEVRQLTGYQTDEVTDAEITSYLERASRTAAADVGERILETHNLDTGQRTGNVQRDIELRFAPDETTTGVADTKVYLQGELLTSGSDYTLNGKDLTIDSSVDVYEGDVVAIKYVPDIFRDYVNTDAACTLLMKSSSLTQGEQVENKKYENAKAERERLRGLLTKRVIAGGYRDHREGPGVH